MILESKEIIGRSRKDVYSLVRDNLELVIPYLPNIDRIEVKSKNEEGDKVNIINHWYAKADMPSLLKKFLKPDIFSWKDTACWDNSQFEVNYQLESFLANDLFDAKGTNSFKDLGDGQTELTIKCEVKIYPEKVPGVPRLLAGKVRPLIESLIEKMLGPNLSSLGVGLKEYYSNQ